MTDKSILEVDVEEYFHKRLKAIGGDSRKLKWIGRRSAPDRFAMFRGSHLVELKRPGEKPRPDQVREHIKLRSHGVPVWVLSTFEQVDHFIDYLLSLSPVVEDKRKRKKK